MLEFPRHPVIDGGRTAPLFLYPSIARMQAARPDFIRESFARRRSFNGFFTGFFSPDYQGTAYVKVALFNVGHSPDGDTDLSADQIVVNDGISELTINLPGNRLNNLNNYRRLDGLAPVSEDDLKSLHWTGNVVLFNQYANSGDRHTLIYLRETRIQARETSTTLQQTGLLPQGI